jgi:hypothetical protein
MAASQNGFSYKNPGPGLTRRQFFCAPPLPTAEIGDKSNIGRAHPGPWVSTLLPLRGQQSQQSAGTLISTSNLRSRMTNLNRNRE